MRITSGSGAQEDRRGLYMRKFAAVISWGPVLLWRTKRCDRRAHELLNMLLALRILDR